MVVSEAMQTDSINDSQVMLDDDFISSRDPPNLFINEEDSSLTKVSAKAVADPRRRAKHDFDDFLLWDEVFIKGQLYFLFIYYRFPTKLIFKLY
jgi:hypothetical protein